MLLYRIIRYYVYIHVRVLVINGHGRTHTLVHQWFCLQLICTHSMVPGRNFSLFFPFHLCFERFISLTKEVGTRIYTQSLTHRHHRHLFRFEPRFSARLQFRLNFFSLIRERYSIHLRFWYYNIRMDLWSFVWARIIIVCIYTCCGKAYDVCETFCSSRFYRWSDGICIT